MMRSLSFLRLAVALLVLCRGLSANHVLTAQTPVATTTTLTLSPTTASTGTAVLLTATVAAGGNQVTPGQVLFCDATAAACQGSALLGSPQLISGGTATLRLVPGIGNHSIKAVFTGTTVYTGSASAAQSITITGSDPTSTSLSFTGTAGSYTLNATVGYQGLVPPGAAEDVLFTDTSNQNLALGSAVLGSVSPPIYSFTAIASSPFASGNLPSAIVSADFNSDGIPDIAIANYSDNTVAIYTGDGIGGYNPATGSPVAVGAGPSGLAISDFNSDGHADLAVVNALSGTITILLGDGTGAFSSTPSISTLGSGPQSIAVADFNRDGIPDIAITNQLSSTITVLLGDGTGLFTPTPDSPIFGGGNPSSIAALDFDLDGNPDLAIANTYDGTVSLLLGDGTGAFTSLPASPFAVPAGPSSLATADFDGDGRADLVILSASGDTLSILLNKVSGAVFASGSPFATGSSPSALAIGDFNGGGAQDIAIANANSSDVTLLLSDGSGGFTPAAQSPLGNFNAPAAIVLADIDGDGRQDLIVPNAGANSISLRPQVATQTASASLASLSVFGGGTHLITAAYPGDTSYAPSTSNAVSLTGSLIATSTSISISPSSIVAYRATVQLTSSITPAASRNYTSTGTIAFTANAGSSLGFANVTNGLAALSVNSLPVGHHRIAAVYSGDANFIPSTVSGTLTIVQAGTVTRLSASSASGTPGASITLSANVASVTSGTPTGSINFTDSATAQLLGTATLNGGVASFSITSLAAGTHSITAIYFGDANYTASTSNPVDVSTSDFSLSCLTPPQTIPAGAATNYTITATPAGTFSDPITFTVSGLPSGAIASFQPTAVTPGTSPASSVLTVRTTRQTALLHLQGRARWVTLALLFLPWCSSRLRRAARLRAALISLLACCAFTALLGCGTSTSFYSRPAKTYTLVVTGTSDTVHHAVKVALTLK